MQDFIFHFKKLITILYHYMRAGQTVQSDQGLHCLPFCLHRLDSLLYGRATEILKSKFVRS